MSGHAKQRSWTRRLRKSPHLVTAMLVAAVAVPVSFASSASAASTFGGFELDGNLTASAALDWDSAAVQVPLAQPIATDNIGGSDTSVFTGSKEDNPDGWALKATAPGKDDIGPVYAWDHVDPGTGHQYVYFGFERASNVGSVNFVVELNQKDKNNSHGVEVPDRQAGDVRFNVTQVGNNPSLAADGVDQFDGTNYVPIPAPGPAFDSAVNPVAIAPLDPNDPVAKANGGMIPADQFAEFGFDLTAILTAQGKTGCGIPPFHFLNARSRASDVNNAEVKDFIKPVQLNLPGSCFDLKITKDDGANPLGGATFTISPDPTTGKPPALTVTDGGANDPDNTSNGVLEFASAIPLAAGQNYTVTETVAPPGYLLDSGGPQSTTGAPSFGAQTLSFSDSLGSVTFTKVKASDGSPQCCATFKLTRTSAPPPNVSAITVTDNGAKDADNTAGTIKVTGLATGDWKIEETNAPSGFGIDPTVATFTISDATPNPVLAAPTFSDPVAPVVDVGIDKVESHNPNNVNAGDTLNYSLTVTNNGNGPAAAITVTDLIPATITNPDAIQPAASPWTCGIVANTLTCTLPAGLAAGASADAITLTGTADDSALGAPPSTSGSISNTAQVDMAGDGPADGHYTNNTSTATTPIVAPDLRIIKEANPDPATVGAPLTYTLHVRNVGAGPTTAPVTVTDTLDPSLTISSASGAGWNCPAPVGQTVTCTLVGSLAANTDAGDITIAVTPTQVFAAPGVPNTATIATAHDPNAANNSSSIHTVVKPTPASPAVAFADSCGPPSTITVTATNVGGTDETLDITKPDGTHENLVVPANTAAATPATTKVYNAVAGQSVSVSGPDLVGSPVVHNFSLNCAGPPPPGAPNLTLAKSSVPAAGSTVQRGDSITYTLTYANTGNAPASTVVTSDPLPADVNFTSASAGGTYDANTRTVSWAIGNLGAGTGGSVSFVVTVAQTATDGEQLTNVATIGGAGLGPVQSNPDTVTVSVPATPTPTLAVVKSVDKKTAEYDDNLTYTLVVTTGGTDQTGVIVTDKLPDGTDYVPASATCSTGCSAAEAAGVVTWNVGDMAQGDTVTLTFTVLIVSPTPAADGGIPPETVTNFGVVGSDQVDPIDSNTVKTDIVAVLGISNQKPPTKKPTTEPTPLPFTGLPFPLLQTVVLSSVMILVGMYLTRPRRRRPTA